MDKVKILDIEIYTGNKIEIGVDKYIKHFKQKGKDVEHLYKEVLGRNSRLRRNDANENSLTMSVQATLALMEKNNLSGEDIDLIVFSSQTPEFLIPATSIMIHKQINGKPSALCFDINVNCGGMVTALSVICKYMSYDSKFKKALLIGCDLLDPIADPENEVTYGQYGDAACCVLLEKTEEDCGLIEHYSCIESKYDDRILFPTRGLNKTIKSRDKKDKYITWLPFDGTVSVKPSAINIKKLLNKYNLSTDNISRFCCSQFSKRNIEYMTEELGLDIMDNKIPYIGDKYGYTGTTSPFLVLYELIENNKIARDDFIVFWGVGAGWQTSVLLFKY